MCPLGNIEHHGGRIRGVIQAQAPDREVVPDGVDRRFVTVPPVETLFVARVGQFPGDPDLPGALSDMKFKQPPVSCDRPGRRRVHTAIGEERYGGRIGEPRLHQRVLTAVTTDDDRLARRDTLLSERHDQGAKLGVGAVEAGLMEVAYLPAGGARPHHKPPIGTRPRCSRPRTRATRRTIRGIDRTKTGIWHFCAYESRARRARWSMNRTADMSKISLESSGASWIRRKARSNAI